MGLLLVSVLIFGLAQNGFCQDQNAPRCGDSTTSKWTCSDQLNAPTFVQAGTCLCIAESSTTPAAYVDNCLKAGAVPIDIRNSAENVAVAMFMQQIATGSGTTNIPEVWIGLVKNANGVDIWNDQCTNSTPSYVNYDGGSSSSLAGAAYTIMPSKYWKGYAPSVKAGIIYGLCRKDSKPCGRNLCKNGATCVNSGNCYTCTCPTGYNGKYCDQDVIEVGCDDEAMTFSTIQCASTITISTKNSTSPQSSSANPTSAVPVAALQNDQSIQQSSKNDDCTDYIKCHLYWVILIIFSSGLLLIAVVGLIFYYCCKRSRSPSSAAPIAKVDPVVPIHEPPPAVIS